MNLFLSGGGYPGTNKVDEAFVAALPANPKLLYIPIALDPIKHPYPECLVWLRSIFTPLGVTDYEMWTDLNQKNWEDLARFDGMYIGGGNTYSLLNDIRVGGFDAPLSRFIESNKPVYGGSAGAIIMGIDLATCAHMDKNLVDLADDSGFNLVHGHGVWCHYTEADDELIAEYQTATNNPVLAFAEHSGLQVTSEGARVLGNHPSYHFVGSRKISYQPEEKINFA